MFGQPTGHAFQFECPTFTEAVNRLLYVVEQNEPFVLFTGRSGTGRSTLLRHVQTECQRNGHSAVVINVAAMDETAVLQRICAALSIVTADDQSRPSLMNAIRDELVGRGLCHHRTVIILDDLDRAVEDLTSTIQFLTAISQDNADCATLIVGSDQHVPLPLSSLSALRVELQPLSETESDQFARQLFKTLHVDAERLTDDAVDALTDFGQGLPGRLKRLCEIAGVALTTDSDLVLDADMLQQLTGETLLSRAG